MEAKRGKKFVKRICGLLLSAALVVTGSPMIAMGTEETVAADCISIVNASFEDDAAGGLTGWTVEESSSGLIQRREAGTGDFKAYQGNYTLQFYSEQEYTANIYQTIENVPNGRYRLSAYVGGDWQVYGSIYGYGADNSQESKCGFNQGSVWTEGDSSWTQWKEVTVNQIEVSDGTITIGARIEECEGKENAGKTLWIDNFQLIQMDGSDSAGDTGTVGTPKGSLLNGSFEEDIDGSYIPKHWTTEGTVLYESDNNPKEGARVLSAGMADAETDTRIYQTVEGLEPGKYTFTVYAQTDTLEECYLYGSGTGNETVIQKNILSGWMWQENKITNIKVGQDGKATVGVRIKANPNTWAIFDSFSLTPTTPYSEEGSINKNGSFEKQVEEGLLPDWDVSVDTGTVTVIGGDDTAHTGDHYLDITGQADYAVTVSQEVADVEPGYYCLTAYAKKSRGSSAHDQKICYLYANGTGQSKCMTAIPRRGVEKSKDVWTLITVRGIYVADDGKVELGVYTDAYAGNELKLDTVVLQREANQDRQYRLEQGGDMSMITWLEDEGAVFKDAKDKEGDCFQILADTGYNIARLRLYTNPGKGRGDGNYYCPKDYETLEDILEQARRAKDKGMKIQLSFHYSDYWSNASTQIIPDDWQKQIQGMDEAQAVAKLEELMAQYTTEVMEAMKAQGTSPEYVSLGNEMQNGLLYPLGKASSDRWKYLAGFLNAGANAVKACDPNCKIILHLDGAGDEAKYTGFFDNCEKYNVSYDIIGISYYPFWTDMEVSQIVDFCNMLADRYAGKDIIWMETGFNFNDTLPDGKTGQLYHNGPYPFNNQDEGGVSTPENQREFMYEVLNGIKSVKDGRCIGDLYWDPIMVEQENVGWAVIEETDQADKNVISNTALFDFNHKLLPVADAYRYNKEGNLAKTGIIDGIVTGTDGKGVAGIQVQVSVGDSTYPVKTDRYGTFRLEVPEGNYSVGAAVSGMECTVTEHATIQVSAQDTCSELVHIQAEGISFRGKVVDENGAIVTAAEITAEAQNGSGSFRMESDTDGGFQFSNIPAGTYAIRIKADGYEQGQPEQVTMNADTVSDLIIKKVSGSLYGQIKDTAGNALAGVLVTAKSDKNTVSVKTEADGSYQLNGLYGQTAYTVTYEKRGYVTIRDTCTVDVNEKKEKSLSMQDNIGGITGKIIDVKGNPVAGAKVGLSDMRSTVSDSSGIFKLDHVLAGTAKVSVTADGYMGRNLSYEVIQGKVFQAGNIIMPQRVALVNPSFEGSSSELGWLLQSNPAGSAIIQTRSSASRFDGTDALAFWSDQAFEADASQAVQGLQAGTYVFRVHAYTGVTHSQWMDGTFYMYVKDAQGNMITKKDIPNTAGYIPIEMEFTVNTAGDYTVGFYMQTVSEDWAVLDLAELGYCGIINEDTQTKPGQGNGGQKPSGSGSSSWPGSPSTGQTPETTNPPTQTTPGDVQKPQDESVTTTKTAADGTVITTTTLKNEDGSTVITVIKEKPDGVRTQSVKEIKDGTTKETIAKFDQAGGTLKTIYITTYNDQTCKAAVTVTEVKDGKGSLQYSKAVIEQPGTQVRGKTKACLFGETVRSIQKAARSANTKIKVKVQDSKGKKLYTFSVDSIDLLPGNELYIYAYNSSTNKYTMVNAASYQVSRSGNVMVVAASGRNYVLLNESDSKATNRHIMKTIKLSKSKKTIKMGKSTKITLSSKADKASIAKISYSTSDKKVAVVSKKGVIKTKGKGSVKIKAKVMMKNGTNKVLVMEMNVK